MRLILLFVGSMLFTHATHGRALPGDLEGPDQYFWQLIGSPSHTNQISEPNRLVLRDDGGRIVGYAWRLQNNSSGTSLAETHAIISPGFDVSFGEPPETAGTIDSYIELAKQLKVKAPAGGNGDFAASWLANNGRVVWLIDYLNRQGAITENSKAVQALLKHPIYISQSGPTMSALYGYSMGGLVSRHALLLLEAQGEPHNVGAYVSLDAPHRGAFLPPSLEVVVRTTNHMIRRGFDKWIPGSDLRDTMKQAKNIFNSAASKQLLGIYIGKAVTSDWSDSNEHYTKIENNNDLARDAAFYRLREELVDLGGYPMLPLNIGVSFGRSDGQKTGTDPAGYEHVANWRVEVDNVNSKVYQGYFRTIRGRNLCQVKTATDQRNCPELLLANQSLQGVFRAPGSTSTSYTKFTGAILSEGDTDFTDSTAWVEDSVQAQTFVPTVSAFDAKGWAANYPSGAAITTLSSPFDVLIADQGGDNGLQSGESGVHSRITVNILQQIQAAIASSAAMNVQRQRIGSFQSSPSSDYWNNAGQFDVVRYIVPEHIRHLPVVADAETTAGLLEIRDDLSKYAATIAAGY